MIRLNQITVAYANRPPVLRELTLEIKSGEAVCIMGANGCGKSTLARVIAGLIEPLRGEIIIDQRKFSVADAAHHEFRHVGILFQDPDNQMVAVTVDKEIAFALENANVPMAQMEPIVTETLEHFGITHLRNRLTSELSGGEKQRVALAAVMVARPPILVLDEPDSFLDEAGKQILAEQLTRMHKADPSLVEIRITQYPNVARQYSRLIVMHGGTVVADRDPDSILADHDSCRQVGLRYDESMPAVISDAVHRSTAAHTVERVRLSGVSFGYAAGNPIIRDLSLEWRRGETIGLIGKSGSGKSSLGAVLCGLLKPLGGKVDLLRDNGSLITKRPKAGWIAGLFQQPERQFFLSSCAEEVAFGPKNLGVTLTNEEIAEQLTLVGLEPSRFALRDPFSLSMGEKRRLAFAAVLSMNPSFVVFDEPTCSLDPEGVGRFIRLSRTLRQRGIGQVVISHDSDIIRQLADRVICLPGDGHAVEVRPDELSGA